MSLEVDVKTTHWSWGARLLLLLVVFMAGLLIWQVMQPWLKRPLQQIILHTDIPASQRVALQAQLNLRLSDSFFGADLQDIRQSVEDHAWVNDAKVSRVWPNRLMVEAHKQIFIARWQDGGFINHEGELVLVNPSLVPGADHLPLFTGPQGSAWFMSQLYRQMSWLVGRDDLIIDQLSMAHRGAVELLLKNGIVLVLGRKQMLPRLQRLMKVYHSHFLTQEARIERIDGRYPHGVSVAWKTTT
ncbi:MAG: cell division protein FtsQ/DivIB [Gammaproteobacteria bacterium]|nr:cell division protein FtsQ/DivIB [Gammaproteobacteria bacterium]